VGEFSVADNRICSRGCLLRTEEVAVLKGNGEGLSGFAVFLDFAERLLVGQFSWSLAAVLWKFGKGEIDIPLGIFLGQPFLGHSVVRFRDGHHRCVGIDILLRILLQELANCRFEYLLVSRWILVGGFGLFLQIS
jgi:hypothetical protein